MQELVDTIKPMISKDYKDRFKAEYYQTKIRFDKLYNMIIKLEIGKLDFSPCCPIEILTEQCDVMSKYLHVLKIRAELEGIEL